MKEKDDKLYEALDIVLALHAEVETETVDKVLSGHYDGSNDHYRFALWCKLNYSCFHAACVLAGALSNADIDQFYNIIRDYTE